MLLPLFLVQILYPDLWKQHVPIWRPVYVACIFTLVMFQVIWSLLSVFDDQNGRDCDPGPCFYTESMSSVFRWLNIVSFLVLSVVQSIYAKEVSLQPKIKLLLLLLLLLYF